ncbi:MAG: thermonuclease family protein [Thermoleophilia bacterium]
MTRLSSLLPAVAAAAVAVAVAVAAAGCGGGAADAPAPVAASPARVVRVVDGDTVILRLDGDDRRVRLLGVDAPESVTSDRPVECWGPQAAAAARRLMPKGAAVAVATDPTQGDEDRYGRLLGEVTVGDAPGTVNVALVREGAAEVFRGDGRGRLQPQLRAAEREARDAGRGLWGSCRRR